METFHNFIELLRADRLEELSKIGLLHIYRNLDMLEVLIRRENDWPALLERLKVPANGGEAPDVHEVNIGLSYLEAFHKADRCLECYGMPCSTGRIQFTEETLGGCPVLIDIPAFIKLVKEGKIFAAWKKLMERDSLPAITGRVCPQEDQCQLSCSTAIKDEPVEIGRLERYVADYVWENHPDEVIQYVQSLRKQPADNQGLRHHVAVIGSGPSGLTVAMDLAIMGHEVTIFESLHVAGGVLAYGIPVFRLPNQVLERELSLARALGINFVHNITVGRSMTVNELFDHGFSAVFIGTGAGLPRLLNIPGENLKHVYSANEFLVRINLMGAYQPKTDTPFQVGENVVVVGGGFTAIDAARWAKRLGGKRVTIMYRRSRQEMPAREEEVENALDEGIELRLLTTPIALIGNKNGDVQAMICVEMELGEADSSGRRRPIPIEGSEYEIPVNTVITSLGTTPNPIILDTTEGLAGTRWGTVAVKDGDSGKTTLPYTYAGGDAVTGAATVILAMGAGKRASKAIHLELQKKETDADRLDQSLALVAECSQPYAVRKIDYIAPDVYELVVHAPIVARYCQPGQFVLVMKDKESERIPLTIADWNREKGEITLVFQVIGKGTADLENLSTDHDPDSALFAVSGPLGKPSEIEKIDGKLLMVAGGVGLAAIYPIMKAHHEIGNDVYLAYGARSESLLFWLDRIKRFLPEERIFISTDDGSYGVHGFVTNVLKEMVLGTGDFAYSMVIGHAIMMREVANLLMAHGIPTVVSLNPMMLDGSAMCGGCRVSRKNGKLGADDFACFNGPDRYADEVDLNELMSRLSSYRAEEGTALLYSIKQKLVHQLS